MIDPASAALYRRARIAAFCRMSSLAERITDRARPAAARTEPGSPERAVLADIRGSMCDLRAAFSIACMRGETDRIDRNGYQRKVL